MKTWVYGFLVVAACTVLTASFLHGRLTYASDSLVYIHGAESLAAGNGYQSGGRPQTAWPPAYSAVLSIPQLIFGSSVLAFKVTNVVVAVLSLAVLFALFLPLCGHVRAGLFVLLSGAFFPWIYYTHFVGSDILFALAVSLFLLFSVRYHQNGRMLNLWLMTVMLMWAPLIRMAGVALLPAWFTIAALLVFRQRGDGAVLPLKRLIHTGVALIVLILPLAVWAVRNILISGHWTSIETGANAEYMSSLASIGVADVSLWTKIWINVKGYAHILLLPDQASIVRLEALPILRSAVCIAVSGLVLVGWVQALTKRGTRPLAISFAFYGGMLLVHNWYDIRYLIPLMGVYFFFLFSGVDLVAGMMARCFNVLPHMSIRESWSKTSVSVLLGLFVCANAVVSIAGPQARRLRSDEYQGTVQDLYEACEYIKASSVPGDVLVSSAGFVGIWTTREVVSVLSLLDSDAKLLERVIPPAVRFIILMGGGFVDYRSQYMEPIVEANSALLTEVFRRNETVIYMVAGDGREGAFKSSKKRMKAK